MLRTPELPAPGPRPGLGPGRRRRLPPRRAHRPRPVSDAYRDAELLADRAATRRCAASVEPDTALAGYQRQRDRALREVFELTVALAGYPPRAASSSSCRRQLGRALDAEAAELAARPLVPDDEHQLATA